MKNNNLLIAKHQSKFLLECVITYAESDFSIIPMMESGDQKKPYVEWKKWQKERPSIEQLKKWWTQLPNANIGVVTGPISNIIVLDSSEDTTTENETQSGIGDIVFAATYYLYEGDEDKALLPMVDFTGKVKFPSADEEKGLGTGETDYSMESDLTWFTDEFAIFGTIGYKFLGSPET